MFLFVIFLKTFPLIPSHRKTPILNKILNTKIKDTND